MFDQYWPSITAAPNASLATANSSEIVTQVVGNITMTSPSVYLIFDHLQAMSTTDLDLDCSLSSPLGATGTVRWAGGGEIKSVGGPYTNAVVSLDATGLSSLVRDLGAVNTASVVSEIAHGGPSYSYWINAVRGTGRNYGTGYYSSVMAKSVDYADFMVPDAEAYYMNINGALGCNRMGDHPQCSTIYDDAYKAQLLVPKEVRTLRPEWATCFDPLFGALDPPIALTQVASIKTPGSKPAPIALTPVDTVNSPEPSSEPTKGTPPKETPPSDQPKQTDPATPGHTVPSDAGPTAPPSKGSSTALPASNPDDEPNEQGPDGSDDKPSNNGKPSNNDNPSSKDSPSNDNPSTNDKPSSNDSSSSNDSPSNNDDPSNNNSNNNNNNPSNNDSPSDGNNSKDNGDSSSTAPTQDGNSAGKPQNGASGSSSSHDHDGASGEDSNKEPQNALDVFTAAQQSTEAKATASPGSGNSEGSGSGGSSASGSLNDEDGAIGATDSSSSENSGVTHGQGSGGNVEDTESNGQQTSSDDQDSGENNGAGASSDAHKGSAEQVVSIDGKTHTIAEQNGMPAIDGTPLPTDGSPVTVDGQSVKVVDGGIVIGTRTVELTSEQTADSQAAVFTANGQAFTAVDGSNNGIAIIDGTTLSVGGQAVTAHGATISAASNGVVVDGSTIEYGDAGPTASPAVLTLGSNILTASAVASDIFAIGTVDLTAGGSDATISGHTLSAASTGIVVDGSSSSTDASETQSSQAAQTTSSEQNGQSSTEGSDATKLHTMHWAALIGCAVLLLL